MSGIPNGWYKVSLDRVAYIQTGIAKGGKSPQKPVELPYLRVANVQDGHLNLSEIKMIQVESAQVDRYLLKNGDVLLTEGGDFDKLGRGTVWRDEIPQCLHQNHIFVVRLDLDEILPDFFAAQIASSYSKTYFLSCAKRSTNLASINKTQLSEYPVLLPPLAEQRKIATIIGTWDAAIRTAEKFVAALRARKRALMQRLLTGEVRFPKFGGPATDSTLPSGWQRVRLDQVFKRVQRAVSTVPEHVLSITAKVGFVDQQEKFGRVIAGKSLERYVLLRRGEFAYNKGNSGAYPQGCIYRLEEFEEGAVPNVYFSFSPKGEQTYSDFYKYYFQSGALNRQLSRLINSGVRNDGLLNLSSDEFFGVKILLPSQAEQVAIANVLDCLDQEIAAAHKELDRLRAQKRGLIQRLLTGQVRVAVDEEQSVF